MGEENRNINYPFMDKEEKEFFDKYGEEAEEQGKEIAKQHGLDAAEKEAYRELMGTLNMSIGEYTVDGALLSCSMCKEKEQKIRYKGEEIISRPEKVETRSRIKILEARTETINGLIPVNIEDCKGGMRDDQGKDERVNIVSFGNCGQIKEGEELEKLAAEAGLSGKEEELAEAIKKGLGTCYCFMKLNSEWENLPMAGDYLSGFVMPSAGAIKAFEQALSGYMNFNGKEGTNMLSMLFCRCMDGGIITAQESGQANKAARRYYSEEDRKRDIQNGLYTEEDFKYLMAIGEEAKDYEGFVAVAYEVLNRCKKSGESIREVVSKGENTNQLQYAAYKREKVEKIVNQDVADAAVAVLRGDAENPIGEATFHFGRINGKDLWCEADACSYVKVIGEGAYRNVFYTEDAYGKVHNAQNSKTEDAVIIYDASKDEWLYEGSVIGGGNEQ